MKIARMLYAGIGLSALSAVTMAQVPDLVTGFDAGGRAMGAGGSFYATGVDTLSAVINPSGLGYMDRASAQVAMRNLPTTQTTVTGPLSDLRLSTEEEEGDMGLTHLGVAFPMRRDQQNGPVLSLSYTVMGIMDDRQEGFGLPGGIDSYLDLLRAKTAFVTLSVGKASANRSWSWGLGVVYATQNVRNLQIIDFSDPQTPDQIADNDDTGHGFGGILGFMVTPANSPEFTLGFSLQTPIELDGSGAIDLYSRIPGRASIGVSQYREGLRHGRDSMVLASQIDYYFGGKSSDRVDRTDQTAVSLGIEYGYSVGDVLIPLRFGYRWVNAGGDNFANRSGYTYGIGYRSKDGNWAIDFNFGNAGEGVIDNGYSLVYRFRR
jgi:hypothetical protein